MTGRDCEGAALYRGANTVASKRAPKRCSMALLSLVIVKRPHMNTMLAHSFDKWPGGHLYLSPVAGWPREEAGHESSRAATFHHPLLPPAPPDAELTRARAVVGFSVQDRGRQGL